MFKLLTLLFISISLFSLDNSDLLQTDLKSLDKILDSGIITLDDSPIIYRLIDKKIDMNSVNNKGSSLLHLILYNKNQRIFFPLIKSLIFAGIDIDKKNCWGQNVFNLVTDKKIFQFFLDYKIYLNKKINETNNLRIIGQSFKIYLIEKKIFRKIKSKKFCRIM